MWGMSDVIGPVTVITEDGQLLLPGSQRHLPGHSAARRRGGPPPDRDAQEQVTQLMSANRDTLDALARALLARETLEQDEACAAAGIKTPGEATLVT